MAAMALLLGGCFMQPADELYALPQQPQGFYDLQKAIDTVLVDGTQYSSPVTGTNQQPVQMVDIDGDGVIENENGLMPGYTDRNNSRKNEMNSREGTEPISEGTVTSENGTSDTATDSAMSWTAIIVAVLLAAALVAVVIALIPKRRDDR